MKCGLSRSKVVSILLKAFPHAAEQRNIADWLPLQLFLRTHSSAILSDEDDLDVIFQLVNAKPMSLTDLSAMCDAAFHSQPSADIVRSNTATVMLIGAALAPGEKKLTIPLHLLGDSYSGKTTLRSSLSFVFKPNQPYLRVFRTTPRKVSQDSGDEGRTVGMEIEVMTRKERHWLVHDYGGQHRMHVDHSGVFSGENPVYVVVLPLWNPLSESQTEEIFLSSRYLDWLRFINSACGEGWCSCITVLNFLDQVGERRGKEIVDSLKVVQSQWSEVEVNRIRFIDTILVNANKPSDIEGTLKSSLASAARSREASASPLLRCVELVRAGKIGRAHV